MLQERKERGETVRGNESAEMKSLNHLIFHVLGTRLNAPG